MKALSLRQPYADLIVMGRKTIELRSWNTKHRGKFLIHASKYKPSASELEPFDLNIDNLEFGALIGSTEVIGVKDYDNLDESQWYDDIPHHLANINYVTSTKGFILKNPVKFPNPIPYKGQLNFFNTPDNIQRTLLDITPQITTVVNARDSAYDILIARPSKWGNPYIIGPDGNREQVIQKYRRWIKTQPQLIADLPELKNKVLACWCRPKACHGDVLKELVEKIND